MTTRKLYYEDVYLSKFNAEVTEITTFNKKAAVVLNQTAFFPEGGGQTSDIGFINDIKICDVQIENGIIYHLTNDNITINVGDAIEGCIDWNKRFSDMQNHSGEHIFSGIIHSKLGLDNLGFHLGTDAVTLDFGRVITNQELEELEFLVNKAIWENRKIICSFPTFEELDNIQYRSKKEINDQIRLVEIEGIDICACCAPHVTNTGEIGIVKVIGSEKLRGGTRISILCGERAFNDIKSKINQNKQVSIALSEKEYETSIGVNRLKNERDNLKLELSNCKRNLIKLEAENFSEDDYIITSSEYSGDFLRHFANELIVKAKKLVFVYNGNDNNYQFIMLGKDNFSANDVLNEMKAYGLQIRGGGRNNMIQGSIFASEQDIIKFFSR